MFARLHKSNSGMSYEMFCAILNVLTQYYLLDSPDRGFELLEALTQTARFGMLAAMLDNSIKQQLQQVAMQLVTQQVPNSISTEKIINLRGKFHC